MRSESDRLLCCVALWLLAAFLWCMPAPAQSADMKGKAEHVDVSIDKAEQAFQEGHSERAFQMISTVINESPEAADAYYALGTFYEEQGDLPKAADAYKAYLAKRGGKLPSDPAVLVHLRRFGLF